MENNRQLENYNSLENGQPENNVSGRLDTPDYDHILKEHSETQITPDSTPLVGNEESTSAFVDSGSNVMPINSKPRPDIYKLTFFLSLFLFLTVSVVIAFNLKNKTGNQRLNPTVANTNQSSGTSSICELNGKTYQLGESFAAADNCNTCTCEAGGNIVCTEKACKSSSTQKIEKPDNIKYIAYKEPNLGVKITIPSEINPEKINDSQFDFRFKTKPKWIPLTDSNMTYFTLKYTKDIKDFNKYINTEIGDPKRQDDFLKFQATNPYDYYYYLKSNVSSESATNNYLITNKKETVILSAKDTDYLRDEVFRDIVNSISFN